MTDPSEPTGDDVIRLIAEAATGQTEAAAHILDDIATRSGFRGLYASTCAIAEAFIRLTGMTPDGLEDYIGLEFDGPNGSINPQDIPERSQAGVWCGQFVAAHANRDFDQTRALFLAAHRQAKDPQNPVGLVDRICTLLHWTSLAIQAKANP